MDSMTSYVAGDPCPKCGYPMEEQPGAFFLHEAGLMPGIVCTPCNALYNSQQFVQAIKARTRRHSEEAGTQ